MTPAAHATARAAHPTVHAAAATVCVAPADLRMADADVRHDDGLRPAEGIGFAPGMTDRMWFARPVLAVAENLVGAFITVRSPEGTVTIRLTEVEAYAAHDDPGSHAFRGPTARNAAMFGEPGRLYVYRHLGLHHCVNVVTGSVGQAAAVLLRAGEVIEGVDLARARRQSAGVVNSDRELARGPARLAVALGLDLSARGADLTDPFGRIVLHRDCDPVPPTIATGPRVGIGGEGADPARFPWRLWLVGDPTVSAYRRPASRNSPQRGATPA